MPVTVRGPGLVRRARLAWRHQVGPPALRSRCSVLTTAGGRPPRRRRRRHRLLLDLSSVLILSGLLLLIDAGVTLVWQEPVTAAIGLVMRSEVDKRYLSYRRRRCR